MANAECIKRVADIVSSDDAVSCVVVSAPGKRAKNDTKVTDLLYACLDKVNDGLSLQEAFKPIEERFDSILKGLNLNCDFKTYYDEIKSELAKGATKDYIASRGEFLSAVVLSEYLNWKFIDAKDFVRFDDKGNFLSEETKHFVTTFGSV